MMDDLEVYYHYKNTRSQLLGNKNNLDVLIKLPTTVNKQGRVEVEIWTLRVYCVHQNLATKFSDMTLM